MEADSFQEWRSKYSKNKYRCTRYKILSLYVDHFCLPSIYGIFFRLSVSSWSKPLHSFYSIGVRFMLLAWVFCSDTDILLIGCLVLFHSSHFLVENDMSRQSYCAYCCSYVTTNGHFLFMWLTKFSCYLQQTKTKKIRSPNTISLWPLFQKSDHYLIFLTFYTIIQKVVWKICSTSWWTFSSVISL